MSTPEPGVPYTSGGVDDMTEDIEARNDAAEDAAVVTDEEVEALAIPAAPVVVSKTDAAIVLSTTQNTWADIDAGGTAAARPLDLVIPGVAVGQWVSVNPVMHPTNAATSVQFDIFTIVAGAPVHQFGGATTGVSAWLAQSSVTEKLTAVRSYQLQAGDIENGAVRLRMRSRNLTTTARSLNASAGFEFRLEGRGPFG